MVRCGHRRFWTNFGTDVFSELWLTFGKVRLAPDHSQVDPGYNARIVGEFSTCVDVMCAGTAAF